jgi:tetraacyldisaccharide 4'-kinase
MKIILQKIASMLYGMAIHIRNMLFDKDIIKGKSYDIPIICIGNITAGGTGKTPMVELVVSYLSQSRKVAVLSRGYGRRTRGYRVVDGLFDHYLDVGDEPLQIKRKFPQVPVIVCERRTEGIERLMEQFPDTEIIVMDDGFQHRYVSPLVNIVIIDYNRPVERDHLLPYGQLRDTTSSLYRAHYFIVTKCPETMKPINMRERKYLMEKPSQEMFFSRMQPLQPCSVFAEVGGTVEHGAKVIALSGIGDNEAFYKGLAQRYKVVDTIELDDHHSYRMSDLKNMMRLLEQHPGSVIMTTEKDAVKLAYSKAVPEKLRQKLFYEKITMRFIGDSRMELFQRIDNDIKNKDNGTYIKGL